MFCYIAELVRLLLLIMMMMFFVCLGFLAKI